MPRIVLVITMLLALFVGCADKAAKQTQSDNEVITRVLDSHRDTTIGFVPEKQSVSPEQELREGESLLAYGLKARQAIIRDLKDAASRGTKSQQRGIRKLLADAHASWARHAADKAMIAWSRLASQSTVLLTQLAKIERSTSQLQLLNRSEAALLDTLLGQRNAIENRVSQYHLQIQGLRGQIDKHQTDQLSYQMEREAQEALAARSTVLIGEARGPLILELAEKVRQAGKAVARAEAKDKKEELEINTLASELRVVEEQWSLAQAARTQVAEEIKRVMQREEVLDNELVERQIKWKTEFENLRNYFKELTYQFETDVHKPLNEAAERMTLAIKVASHLSSGGLELITMQLGKLHVLTQHIITQGSFGHTLGVLASGVEKLLAEIGQEFDRSDNTAQYYREQADHWIKIQRELIVAAEQLRDMAIDEAQALSAGPDQDVGQIAKAYEDLFAIYQRRIIENQIDIISKRSAD